MPEVNFNLLAPTAELYSGPQVQMDPVAAYEKAKATRQSNMLAQLYAKHYDPQTGGVNYNALIGEAAQSGLDVPKLMGEAQKQAQAQAELSQTQAQQKQNEAAAREYEAKTKGVYDENRHKEVNRAISDISKYANKADAIAGIERNFEEGKLDQNAYDAVMGMVRAEPVWARSQSKILQSLLSEKEQLEMAAPKTSIGKLQSDYDAAVQRGDKVAAVSIKKAIDVEAGGMTQYQQQSLQIERDKIKLLQDKANKGDTTADAGKELLTSQVISLRDTYDALSEKGGIVDTKAPWYKNLGAWASSTGPGQTVGKALGTDTQSLRNTIAQSRPLLLNAIKQATGMTAKQMDSNVELQMYLKAATDPTADIQSNRKALQKLNDLFGLGIDLGPIESSATPSPALGGAGMGAGPQPAATGGWGKATVVSGGK